MGNIREVSPKILDIDYGSLEHKILATYKEGDIVVNYTDFKSYVNQFLCFLCEEEVPSMKIDGCKVCKTCGAIVLDIA